MAGPPTVNLREVATVHSHERAESDGIPVGRSRREQSDSLSRAALEQIDRRIREKTHGPGLQDETKQVIAAALDEQFNRLLRHFAEQGAAAAETRTDLPKVSPARFAGRIGWMVAAILAVVLFVGALGVTWFEIWSVKQAQRADDEYAMIVANWLVQSAGTTYEQAHNVDQMLRIIGSQIGVDLSAIEAPSRTHPPTAVQRKNNDYKLSIGE